MTTTVQRRYEETATASPDVVEPSRSLLPAPTSLGAAQPAVTRVVRHGDVEIVVAITPDGRFLGISEVRLRRDFLNVQQRVAATGVHDVDHLYND